MLFSLFRKLVSIAILLATNATQANIIIDFSTSHWQEQLVNNSHLADGWQKNPDGSNSIVPGALHQQNGKSSFKVETVGVTNPVLKITFETPTYEISNKCNLYFLSNERVIWLSESPYIIDNYHESTFTVQFLPGTKTIELGILPKLKNQDLCNVAVKEIRINTGDDISDIDEDSYPNSEDNCPLIYNRASNYNGEEYQLDSNQNGIGDICEFNRTKSNDTELPSVCQSASAPSPDNDKISDICDPDDDNDGLSDKTEIQIGTDIFKPYSPLVEGIIDHDNDGLNLNNEIYYGFDPAFFDTYTFFDIKEYLSGHKPGLWLLADYGPYGQYEYTPQSNGAFDFRGGRATLHYQIAPSQGLFLTGISFIIDKDKFINASFSPSIFMLPTRAMANHTYDFDSQHIALVKTEYSTKEVQVKAMGYSSTSQGASGEIMQFFQYFEITNSDDEYYFNSGSSLGTYWTIQDGFIGYPGGNAIPYNLELHGPIEGRNIEMNDNKNGGIGSLNFLFSLCILLTALSFRTKR